VAALVIGLMLAGCEYVLPARDPAPATIVRITASADAITLDPRSVPAGRVGLEVVSGQVVLISAMAGEDDTPGPLDDAGVQRLRAGDMQGTTTEALQGPWGDPVMVVDLSPGLYALAVPHPDPTVMRPLALEVLQVR
jgi:hypothetical protein